MSVELLRRAWDALDSFKQAYPENWHEEDQQVLDDLIKSDLDLSGVERKWQGLTDEEVTACWKDGFDSCEQKTVAELRDFIARAIEAKLKEKNT